MTQKYSQNGWPAYADTSHYTRLTAAGQGWWCANADVAVVFGEFIRRFDAEVEEITQSTLDDWSYANRLVRDSTTTVSNHGSATAIDINALKHVRGVRGTFSAAKAVKVRAIKNAITDKAGKPVLRLGMDYVNIPDDMHIEINANAAKVKEAANQIRAKNAPKPKPPEGIVVTSAELEALLVKLIKEKPLVANKVLDEGAKQGGDWTLAGVFAAGDQKLDFIRREQARQAGVQDKQDAALAGLTTALAGKATAASVAQLSQKVDTLIGLLTPKPPAT
jgi:hypothetical protein